MLVLLERLEFVRKQRTRTGNRRELADAVSAGFGAVGRREGIHDVDVAECRHLLRQLVLVFLALVEARVLEQDHLARLARHAIEPVAFEADLAAQHFREPRRHRRQRKLFGRNPFLGTAEVRHQQHASTGLLRRFDRRQGRADARVAGDDAVLHRDVQVFADQDPLALEVHITHPEHADHALPPCSGGQRRFSRAHFEMTRAISSTLLE